MADGVPTVLRGDPVGDTEMFAVEFPSGEIHWRACHFGPNFAAPIHRTDTLDWDMVTSGSIEMVLEDGSVRLTVGDLVVIPGVMHGWRTGEEECTMSMVMMGLATGG